MPCEYVVLIRDAIAQKMMIEVFRRRLNAQLRAYNHVKEAEPHSVVSMVRK